MKDVRDAIRGLNAYLLVEPLPILLRLRLGHGLSHLFLHAARVAHTIIVRSTRITLVGVRGHREVRVMVGAVTASVATASPMASSLPPLTIRPTSIACVILARDPLLVLGHSSSASCRTLNLHHCGGKETRLGPLECQVVESLVRQVVRVLSLVGVDRDVRVYARETRLDEDEETKTGRSRQRETTSE